MLQTKLLRVLQEREYRPIGSDRLVKVDFRLICATNIDPDAAMQRRPAARGPVFPHQHGDAARAAAARAQRGPAAAVRAFPRQVQRAAIKSTSRAISPAAYHLLIRFRWPGNVRELENAIERAVLVAKSTDVQPQDLPDSIRGEAAAEDAFTGAAASHAGRDRADGGGADAAAHELEQAGGGADPWTVSADALQQDQEAPHQGSTRGRCASPKRSKSQVVRASRCVQVRKRAIRTVRTAPAAGPKPAGTVRLISLAAWRGVGELYNSEGLTHAASIAYYALLSLFPILLLAIFILGDMTSDAADRDAVVRFVFRYFPRQFGFISGQLDAFQTTPVTLRLLGRRRADVGVARRVQRDSVGGQSRVGGRAAPQLPEASVVSGS